MASTVAGSDSDTESERTRFGSPTSDATHLELAAQNQHDRYVAGAERSRHLVNTMLARGSGDPTIEPDTPTLDVVRPGAASGISEPETPTLVASGAATGPETPALDVVTVAATLASASRRRRTASEELRRVKQAKNKREQKRRKKKRVEAAKAKAARRQATASGAPTPTAS